MPDAMPADLPPPVGRFHYTRFAPRLPALQDGTETQRHAVAIAGGGPVGMALALGLANHGVPSVILEADDTVCVGSRAACISRRSLEIVERLGARSSLQLRSPRPVEVVTEKMSRSSFDCCAATSSSRTASPALKLGSRAPPIKPAG